MTAPDEQFEGWLDRHRVEPLNPAPGTYDRLARTARRRRTVRVTTIAAAVAVAIIGVTGVAYSIATGPGPVLPPAASATPSRSASPEPPSPEPSSPEPSWSQPAVGSGEPPSSPATSTPSQSTHCHTNELKVTAQAAPGGGAPMTEYTWLVFTNVSGRTCSLYGYPGVSWVTGPSGQQVNDPATRESATPARIVLDPGEVAHAEVRHGKAAAFEPDCHAVQVAGLRVYPPDETAAVFVPWASQACSAKGVDVGAVWPIVAGLTP